MDVRLIRLDLAALTALADGDLPAANAAAPVELTPWYVTGPQRDIWRYRARQAAEDPAALAWVTGVVLADVAPVGRAGFHGPPEDGVVEVGYETDPAHRRRGYARAALELLLAEAAAAPGVHTVRASVRPDNTPSYGLIAAYGFVRTGEQVDPIDGLELVYERPA